MEEDKNISTSEKAAEKMVKHTVRLRPDVSDIISDVARMNHTTPTTIIRLCIDNRLEKYLSNVFIYDDEMSAAILCEIAELSTEIQRIRNELHRIGINYNQELKLKNIEAKYKNRNDLTQFKAKEKEITEVMNDTELMDKEEVWNLLQRFEHAVEKAGENLDGILKN